MDSSANSATITNNNKPSLNSVTLSKALTKPPSLSSVLNKPLSSTTTSSATSQSPTSQLLNTKPLTTTMMAPNPILNGSHSATNSSSPSNFQQQLNLSNSLPTPVPTTTAQLFKPNSSFNAANTSTTPFNNNNQQQMPLVSNGPSTSILNQMHLQPQFQQQSGMLQQTQQQQQPNITQISNQPLQQHQQSQSNNYMAPNNGPQTLPPQSLPSIGPSQEKNQPPFMNMPNYQSPQHQQNLPPPNQLPQQQLNQPPVSTNNGHIPTSQPQPPQSQQQMFANNNTNVMPRQMHAAGGPPPFSQPPLTTNNISSGPPPNSFGMQQYGTGQAIPQSGSLSMIKPPPNASQLHNAQTNGPSQNIMATPPQPLFQPLSSLQLTPQMSGPPNGSFGQQNNPPPPTSGPPIGHFGQQNNPPLTSGPPIGPFAQQNKPPLMSGPSPMAPLPPFTSPNVQQQPPPPQQQQPFINQFNNMSLSQPPPPLPNSTIPNSISNHIPQQQYQQQFQQQQQQPMMNQNQNHASRSQPQAIDLQREKRLIMPYSDEQPPRPQFPHEFYTNVNCHSDTMRCTLTSIPESQNLLNKCRLPLGLLIHPFKDLESLKVVQSSTIVRCRNCRSYINPFVQFLDNTKWRCNMCYSINDLPEEFLFDPVTKSYGDPSKRPEINSSTIEFIAPPEYTLRPPPPAMYLYLLDVSHNAINTGYLQSFCETLLENIDKIPGDSRTQIGFITYNSCLHFYNLCDSLSQPRMMIYADISDPDLVLPLPDSLMVNLSENKESIQMFLQQLPNLFVNSYVETDSALGTALNAAYQLLKPTGGRITVMQTCLPNVGEGALKTRDEFIVEKDSSNLAPQSDFYKKLALDCAGVQIAVDLFMFNSLYSDLPTLSCISKYSGGEIKYYPKYHPEHNPEQVMRFCTDLKRYITRKIGFEAVMRIRCTRGVAIHTFHGNFFVRSTDLLALPNVSPDAGFGMQLNIEEQLSDIVTVCFQAAVLYTSSKSERRIRIHTYCLPVTRSVNELVNGADQEAIIGLVSKMAVDRTAMNNLNEAREALVNVAIDYLKAYSQHVTSHKTSSLISPLSLRCIPLYVSALLKNTAFKFKEVKMDDRVYAMNLCKSMPLKYLMLVIYPNLYALHSFDDSKVIIDSYESEICIPPRLHLSSENIDRHGVYLMDCGEAIYIWVGKSVSDQFLQEVFDCKSFNELPEYLYDLPELENNLSEKIRSYLSYLLDNRPFGITFICFKEGSSKSKIFFQNMFDDRAENALSYYEFLKYLNENVNS